ncbi:MAG TPA: HEAT repeat domain-containing protein [Fimbriiglobus sp.]|jgi:HEAT repeat protein|nr:HEAT repeat domain-containing protein [Fimbriiglobus sp.]
MKKRTVVWAVIVLLVAVALALLVPGSPAHVAKLLGERRAYDGYSLGHWRDELASPDKEVRKQAFLAIGAIGPDAEDAVPDVARLLTDDPDEDIRTYASVAMIKMAPSTKTAVPALIQALTDKHMQVRQNAVSALGRLRTDARAAVPALIAAMKDPENDTNARVFLHTIQEGAASVLGLVSEGTGDAVPALTETLTGDATDKVKAAAARSLGQIGEPARPAIPILYAALKHKDRYVREESTIALQALGEKIEPFQLSEEDKKKKGRLKAPDKEPKAADKEPKAPDGDKAPKAGEPKAPPEQAPPPRQS